MVAIPDTTLKGADWTKTSWDIPAENAQELYVFLGQIGMSVEDFKVLPVYLANEQRWPWLHDLQPPPVPA